MSWTQPCCDPCWVEMNPDGRRAVRIKGAEEEQCAWCGGTTDSGIYVREDPKAVPYPAQDES
jgi:hypothetical protein